MIPEIFLPAPTRPNTTPVKVLSHRGTPEIRVFPLVPFQSHEFGQLTDVPACQRQCGVTATNPLLDRLAVIPLPLAFGSWRAVSWRCPTFAAESRRFHVHSASVDNGSRRVGEDDLVPIEGSATAAEGQERRS
jgi:hypothetical protein